MRYDRDLHVGEDILHQIGRLSIDQGARMVTVAVGIVFPAAIASAIFGVAASIALRISASCGSALPLLLVRFAPVEGDHFDLAGVFVIRRAAGESVELEENRRDLRALRAAAMESNGIRQAKTSERIETRMGLSCRIILP